MPLVIEMPDDWFFEGEQCGEESYWNCKTNERRFVDIIKILDDYPDKEIGVNIPFAVSVFGLVSTWPDDFGYYTGTIDSSPKIG